MNDSNKLAETLTVAALQPGLAVGRLDHNLRVVADMVERILQGQGFDLLVLPECFNGTFDDPAPSVSDRTRDFLTELARTHRIGIVGGSVERGQSDGVMHNTTFVYDRSGKELGCYHKRILFGREASRRVPGRSPGVFSFQGWRVGVLNCADCWHPELAREIMHRADLICVPAETAVPDPVHIGYARTLWHNLSFTRAEESAIPLVVSDWAAGELARNAHDADQELDRFTCGASAIVDPSWRPDLTRIQHTLVEGEPGHLIATLERGRLEEFRAYRRRVGLLPQTV